VYIDLFVVKLTLIFLMDWETDVKWVSWVCIIYIRSFIGLFRPLFGCQSVFNPWLHLYWCCMRHCTMLRSGSHALFQKWHFEFIQFCTDFWSHPAIVWDSERPSASLPLACESSLFATTRRAFSPSCVRACYCDILNFTVSCGRFTAVEALLATHLSSWSSLLGHSYGCPDWQSLQKPVGRTRLIGSDQMWGRVEDEGTKAFVNLSGFYWWDYACVLWVRHHFSVIHGHTELDGRRNETSYCEHLCVVCRPVCDYMYLAHICVWVCGLGVPLIMPF